MKSKITGTFKNYDKQTRMMRSVLKFTQLLLRIMFHLNRKKFNGRHTETVVFECYSK